MDAGREINNADYVFMPAKEHQPRVEYLSRLMKCGLWKWSKNIVSVTLSVYLLFTEFLYYYLSIDIEIV